MENLAIIYEVRQGTNNVHGAEFENHTTTLSYLRCEILHRQWKQNNVSGVRSYFVANNVDHVGAFDDVVIRVEYPDGGTYKTKMLFVQCKHFLDPNKGSLDKILDKEITKYFDSYVILQRILNEEMISWEQSNKSELEKYLKNHNDENKFHEDMKTKKAKRENFKDMFKCNICDCEFILYSNYKSAPENAKKIRSNHTDISSKILTNATGDLFEIPLEEKYISNIKYGKYEHFSVNDFEHLKTEFSKRFRIYVTQDDKSNNDIDLLIKPETDGEMIIQLFQQEQQHLFRPPTCLALTENSELIDILENFYQLKNQSREMQKGFRYISKANRLFTKEAIQSLKKHISSVGAAQIPTPFLQLEELKILQFFVTELPEGKLFVHIEDARDLAIWSKARKSKLYKYLKKIVVFSKMENKFSDFDKEANEIFIEVHYTSEASSLDDFILNFSDETTQSILNYEVKLQGFEVTIKDIFGHKWHQIIDENIILEIIKREKVIISEHLLPPLDCYVQRKLKVKTLHPKLLRDVEKYHSNLSCDIKYLVFSDDYKTVSGNVPSIQRFHSVSEARNFIREIEENSSNDTNDDTIHQLCSRCDGKIKLIYSSGKKIEDLHFVDIQEQEFFVSERNKLSILTGPAGMGKSSTLLSLAHWFKSKNPSNLVYFIELNKHLKKFKDFKCSNDHRNGITFIASAILNLEKHNIEHRLFIDACENTGNVALFLDAFDEISPEGEQNLTILLESLEKSSISRIYVSSRQNYVNTLERALTVNGITFSPFDKIDIQNFLILFLKNYTKEARSEKDDNKDKKEFIYCILKSMEENNRLLNEFLYLPLQMKMLAEIYFDKYTELSTEEKSSFSFTTDLYSLYNDCIIKHVESYFVDKRKWNDMQERDRIIAIEDELRDADLLACEIICPDLKTISNADRAKAIVKMRDHVGLLTSIDPPVFLHRTIGEFLTAKFFVTCIKNCNETNVKYISFFCKNILLENRYRDIRRFINAILCNLNSEENDSHMINPNVKILACWQSGETSLHIAATEKHAEIVKFLFRNDPSKLNEKNKNGYTALEIAFRSGCLKSVEIMICNNCQDIDEENLLSCAAESNSTDIIHLIIDRAPTILKKKDRYGHTALNLACLYNSTEAVMCFLKIDRGLVEIADKDGNLPLHYATEHGNIQIVKEILCHNSNLIARKRNDGLLPLHIACKHDHVEVAKYLLTQKISLIAVGCGKKEETPLHFAAINGNIKLMRLLLQHDKTLLNKCNLDGESPLFCTLYHNNTEAANFLLTFPNCLVNLGENLLTFVAGNNSDVNILRKIYSLDCKLLNKVGEKRYTGRTPLLCALESSNIEAAKFLLELPECLLTLDLDEKSPFHYAAMDGNLEIIKLLINKDRSLLLKQDKNGRSALYFAIDSGQTEVAHTLLSCDEYLIEGNILQNELQSVIRNKNFEILTLMLERNSTLINSKNSQELLPLDIACRYDNTEAVKYLLPRTDPTLILKGERNKSILHDAAGSTNLIITRLILEKFPFLINERDAYGRTPLHYALMCFFDNTEVAKLLLNHDNCQVDVCDDKLSNPFHLASEKCNIEVMKMILARDSTLLNRKNQKGQTPLHLILDIDDLVVWDEHRSDAFKYLLSWNCLLNVEDEDGKTPIHLASMTYEIETTKLLLQRDGALLNLKDKNGRTPLHHACECRSNETVSFLLNFPECDINLTDNEGNTPLHHAATYFFGANKVETMSLLVRRDRSLLTATNNKGQTALHLAANDGYVDVDSIEFLLSHTECKADVQDIVGDTMLHSCIHGLTSVFDSNVLKSQIFFIAKQDSSLLNIKNKHGQTPLHIAVTKNKFYVVELLVQFGADAHIKDNDNCTPLDLALQMSKVDGSSFDEDIINFLQKTTSGNSNNEESA